MNTLAIIEGIKQKDFNKQYFVELVLQDEIARDIVVKNLTTNEQIMVYYHCYYVIDLATQEKPEMFYSYFYDFAKLLSHKNSYQRDIALTLIANLAAVDSERKLNSILDKYLALVSDKKFMTGNSCVKNLAKIINFRPDLVSRVINLLLELELTTNYTAKQFELLKYDILNVIDIAYAQYNNQQILYNYIFACTQSTSPKTKRMAKMLLKKYN